MQRRELSDSGVKDPRLRALAVSVFAGALLGKPCHDKRMRSSGYFGLVGLFMATPCDR